MKFTISKYCMIGFLLIHQVFGQAPASPDKVYGQLFQDVQLQKIFPDGKTFVDCTPKRNVKDILEDYQRQKTPKLDLKKFVADNFFLPKVQILPRDIKQEKDLSLHIKNLWPVLKREPDLGIASSEGIKPAASSLLPLPFPYIVPGGRFREVYYWDSYFTMLGLKESNEVEMIENMIKNFAFLIDTYGHIPNGNRSYYLSRSQPPFFSRMVELLAGIKGVTVYKTYLPAMEKEYAYWMDGADKIKSGTAFKHVVMLEDGSLLNRYCDANNTPRPESYKQDYDVAEAAAHELAMRIRVSSPEALKKILSDKKAQVNQHLRSAAESGWDFSSRWFADSKSLETIQTMNIIPVDLNCLLYEMESTIAKAKRTTGAKTAAALYLQKANKRKTAILKYCWNDKIAFFVDYNWTAKIQLEGVTAAGLFPLYVKIATTDQANAAEATTQKYLLKDGGIVTTDQHTGQQWDAPNGWAPLQWISAIGFKNYGKQQTANEIIKRWVALNEKVYEATGKMMEKYNVEDLTKTAGGGEYKTQDGFGWTNGVYLAFKKMLNSK